LCEQLRHRCTKSNMTHIKCGLVITAVVAASGCAVPDWQIDGRITRYFKINHNRFEPVELHVPMDTPFTLAIDVYADGSRVFIVSKDLGIPAQNIRAYVHSMRWPDTNATVRTRILICALPLGRYTISTERYGITSIGVVDVTAKLAQK